MLLVGWIAFVVLVMGASPAHFWLDSGELTAAGYELGVMHPPGAPGLAFLVRLAATLPIGSLAFRASALCSLLGALAVAGVYGLIRGRGGPGWLAVGASLWVLAGWTFTRQARVMEIYALGSVLALTVLWGFDPRATGASTPGRRLIGTAAAVWAAWAFGDLRLALAPAVALGWCVAARRRRPWAAWAPLVVVVVSAVAVAVPLASARQPAHDWGDPENVARWVEHVFARSIRTAFADDIWPASWAMWRLHLGALTRQIGEDLGPFGGIAWGVALVVVARHAASEPGGGRTLLGLGGVAGVLILYSLGINPMGLVDRQTTMLLGPLAALTVAEGLRLSWRSRPRVQWAIGGVIWTALVVPAGWKSLADGPRTRSWMPHAWTRAAFAQLPAGSVLLAQSDDLAAGAMAAQLLEGVRPDVLVLVGQHLHRLLPQVSARGPQASRIRDAVANLTSDRARVDAVLAAADGPVALEYPGVGVFAGVDFWSSEGRIPVRIRDPLHRIPRAPSISAALEAWMPKTQGDEDRKRLATALANDARARVRFENDVQAAELGFAAVIERVRPAHASAWVALAALRDRSGDTAIAIEMTRHALALEPGRAAAMQNLALYLGRHPDTFAEALEWAQHAITLRPHDPSGWQRLAALRASVGDAEGAADAEERAYRLQSRTSSDAH